MEAESWRSAARLSRPERRADCPADQSWSLTRCTIGMAVAARTRMTANSATAASAVAGAAASTAVGATASRIVRRGCTRVAMMRAERSQLVTPVSSEVKRVVRSGRISTTSKLSSASRISYPMAARESAPRNRRIMSSAAKSSSLIGMKITRSALASATSTR